MKKPEQEYVISDGEYTVKKNKWLDLAAKIVSVLFAFIIWLYAVSTNSPVYERTITGITVAVENVPTGLSVISGLDHTIDIKVTGKRTEVLALTASEIAAYVDASACVDAGLHTLPVSVTLPTGMTISEKYPDTVTIYLGTTTSKQLPIHINLRNYTVDTDCVLEKSTPDLSFVTVRGPADELAKIKEARVTIEPGYINSSMTASGNIVLYDLDGNVYSNPYVTSSASDVLVRIDVHKYKTVPLKTDCKYGYYNENTALITLEPAAVRIKGSSDVIDGIDSLTVAVIDETGVMNDGSTVYELSLPEGVTSVNDVKNVKVNIKHLNTTVRTFSVTNMRLDNTEDSKTYELTTDSVNVTLRGTIGEYFSYYDASDITVVLDMSGYHGMSGNVTVPAKIEILNSSSTSVIYPLGSYSVNLIIS